MVLANFRHCPGSFSPYHNKRILRLPPLQVTSETVLGATLRRFCQPSLEVTATRRCSGYAAGWCVASRSDLCSPRRRTVKEQFVERDQTTDERRQTQTAESMCMAIRRFS